MLRVVVIGAGFSGVTVAVLASRAAGVPTEILLVDPRPEPGHGFAHASAHPDHRLNAPAALHTIHPDAPLHFVDWFRAQRLDASDPGAVAANGGLYPRRHDFGRYMADELARHARGNPGGARIDVVRDRAVAIGRDAAGLRVALAGGGSLHADRCVIAVGWNPVGVPAPWQAVAAHPGWIADPWDADRLARVPRDARVLLLGTGLTASDAFAALAAQGHQGPVTALSRRGMRPAGQNPFPSTITSVWGMLRDPRPAFVARHGLPPTVRDVLRLLRADIAAQDPALASWHAPFDSLRDAAAQVWPALPASEKRRFVRHLKGWYDTFRFRNPPQVERILDEAVARGQLRVRAARVDAVRGDGHAIVVEHRSRSSPHAARLRVDAVLNCTGPAARPSASGHPLWSTLIADGVARDHPGGLGVDVDDACRVRDAAGRPVDGLFCVGPPTQGAFGESTAVPFIARQVHDMIGTLLDPGGDPRE
ncbi:MAG: FAD/NAD(P)-binding protein [Burkholderiales bacterium]|jgi:uncharacterized NAD(P)/FAD-binding protein YdhS